MTYTVTITITASVELVTITSIKDDVYGDIGMNKPSQTDNTCPSLIGTTLLAGDSTVCSFKAMVLGNAKQTVTDWVEVCAEQPEYDAICGKDDASVFIMDEWAEPTLLKSAKSAANCQMDVTYQVVVSNN